MRRGLLRLGAALLIPVALAQASCSSEDALAPPGGDACVARPLPSPVAASSDLALARAVADRWIATHPAEELAWDWSEGVLLSALVDLHRATGEPAYAEYARRYLAFHAAKGYSALASDRCAPAIAAATLYPTTCAPEQRAHVERVLAFLYDEALRDESGAINHLGVSALFGVTVWIDSLFMIGEVFVRWADAQSDPRALEAYAIQYRGTARSLQDGGGFFAHATSWRGQEPDVFWARGNGWVLASGMDYLRVKKARGESDPEIEASLTRLAGAVIGAQDGATGLWWTVVNRPGATYLETSASALFAAGLARGRRLGVLDASVDAVIERARAGVRTKIEDGVVTGVSGPTDPGSFSDYARVPIREDTAFGAGAVILALIER